MKIVRGTKALVTGAASGIGRCIALKLAAEGADLWLVDIDAANLEAAAAEARTLGTDIRTTACDLSKLAEITSLTQSVRSAWKRLDILVNSAGVLQYGPAHTVSDEQWDRILTINLTAPMRLTRNFLPLLLARERSHVLNVCSILGLSTVSRFAAYQTSKFGLVGFSLALRAEYARQGVGVTALCPGAVRTPMTRDLKHEPANTPVRVLFSITPDAVAARAVRAIRRNRGLVVVGPSAHLLWWLTRLSPRLVGWLSRKDFLSP